MRPVLPFFWLLQHRGRGHGGTSASQPDLAGRRLNLPVGWTAEPVSRSAEPVREPDGMSRCVKPTGSGAGWRVAVDLQAPTGAAGFAPVVACSYPVSSS